MEYYLRFGSRALKDLRKLDNHMHKRILERIEVLRLDLKRDVKKPDHSPHNRSRIGDFRVLFNVEGNPILVHRVPTGEYDHN